MLCRFTSRFTSRREKWRGALKHFLRIVDHFDSPTWAKHRRNMNRFSSAGISGRVEYQKNIPKSFWFGLVLLVLHNEVNSFVVQIILSKEKNKLCRTSHPTEYFEQNLGEITYKWVH
jgi:hypothetical protein